MDRETGTETQPCVNCGKELAVQTNPDGSTSAVNCEDCWPAAPEQAAAAETTVPREHGVVEDSAEVVEDD